MLSDEQKLQLKALLDTGVLSQKEYEAKINPAEPFSWKKLLKGMFSLTDPVGWSKDVHSIFNLRKVLVYILIIGAIYGYGYVKGIGNKPVHVELGGKEALVELNENLFLHILPDGTLHTQDKNGKMISKIKVKDIPALEKALKPIGVDIKPFVTMGGSVGTGEKTATAEVGLGLQVYKIYKVHLDAWLTNVAAYVGADYQFTENFSALLGVGKGYSGEDNRVYLGGLWKF